MADMSTSCHAADGVRAWASAAGHAVDENSATCLSDILPRPAGSTGW